MVGARSIAEWLSIGFVNRIIDNDPVRTTA